ncbi:ATP-binding protein [Streptomyces achromogenes]|uniref:ATP-binding protein n=1 Tax=Streptomyces achromogenes TaxID=67255 RepID=UPI00369B9682
MPSVRDGAIVAGVIPSAPLGTDAAAGRAGLGAEGGIPARAGSGLVEGAALQGGAAGRRFRFELAAHPGSVARARRLTQARLSGWAVCADTCDSAALVISELVTNAIVHTASNRVVCELHDHDDMVRIAVRDEGCAPGEPHPSPQRPDEEHGRGLLLVDALCRAWGAQEHGPGLLVWAELPRGAESAQDAPESRGAESAPDSPEPRADLGWGARPKPGRPEDSGEDQQAAAERCRRDPGRYEGGALHAERHRHTASAEQPEPPCRTPGQRHHRERP